MNWYPNFLSRTYVFIEIHLTNANMRWIYHMIHSLEKLIYVYMYANIYVKDINSASFSKENE